MEITQMRYFRAIVEYGSFSEAAERLYLTQPALSKSIAKLEAELGAPLFERKGNKISLTHSGKVFLPYCGEVLNAVESGITAFRESVGLKKGQVTIAISTDIFIKHLILQFLEKNPEVSFVCHLMTVEEMTAALEDGSVDFVLSDVPVTGDRMDWHLLYEGHLTAVLHSEDPLLQKDYVTMEDLRDRRFCIGHLRPDLKSAIFQLCNEAGYQPSMRYLGYDPDMAGMLMSIPGSVIISPNYINSGLKESGLEGEKMPTRPIRGTEKKACVGIGVSVRHYQTEAALAFYDMIVEYYRSIR